ncbi:Uncharacterised protein (plasmid) [Tsukamurella tyrosinosolvens]|uniref:Uncharacterized protein n=2 Tax=Tsukamurella tyrosinosolvens TaxID=57704 RepID=A0A1H4WMG5_TSUTY|nr:hypothetical protein [Tsukamurella tyrosinosolvens]KXO99675.1 hypothetical protein AXK58_00130 [Tsukamurella tyrosinosolvens]SEC94445.1 hypothetical protein SAMN04489793_3610 [Tsukamurella tyrosinosolvens]VEH89452.1 Uncharacterised protein [Tsukamurella tyrosinosolvens]
MDLRIARASDEAFRSYCLALMWSVSNRTDGVLLPDDLNLIPGFRRGTPSELVAAGLWTAQSNGWLITDFENTQTTRAQLEAADRARVHEREKKRRQREAKRQADAAGQVLTSTDPVVPGDIPEGVPTYNTGQARTGQAFTRATTSSAPDRSLSPVLDISELPADPDAAARAADALIARVTGKTA